MYRCLKNYPECYFSRFFKLVLSFLVIILISAAPLSLQAQPLVRLSAPDITSGYFHSEDNQGLADELLKEAFRRIGYQLEVSVLPSERSLKMADSGFLDGELLRTRAIEMKYRNLVRVPEPILNIEAVVFSYAPIKLENGWASLNGKSVGLVIGTKKIEESMPEGAIVTAVKSVDLLFNILKQKKISYAVFPRHIGEYFIQNSNIQDVLINEPPLESMPHFTYLNKKHALLVPKLAGSIREMKDDGTFNIIVEKYKHAQNAN